MTNHFYLFHRPEAGKKTLGKRKSIPFFSSENATFFYQNSLFTLWLFNHIMKNTYTLSYKTKTLQINFYFLLFTNIQTWFCESYLSSKTPIWIFVDEQFLLPQHWWSKWEHFQLIHRPSNFQTQNRCHHIWYSDLGKDKNNYTRHTSH